MNNLAQFLPKNYYHVYNRTNNKESLFLTDKDRFRFMDLMKIKLDGYADVLAISLLGNHFHYCIFIKSKRDILEKLKRLRKSDLNKTMQNFLNDDKDEKLFHKLITSRFSGVFNSYAQTFNNKYSRLGNLFYKPYKHSVFDENERIKANIYYIHHNARKHGIVEDFKDHEWHSYHLIVANDKTYIDIDHILKIYNGLGNFIKHHSLFLLEKDLEI